MRSTGDVFLRGFAQILFWLVAVLAVAFATFALAPVVAGHVSDKLLHAGVFVLLALLGSIAYPGLHWLRLFAWLAAFGGLIELIQLIPALGRDSDWRDWVADCLAAGVTLVVVGLHLRISRSASAGGS